MTALWAPVLVTCAGCYALKALGLWVPQRWLERPQVARSIAVLPVALLASLAATQTLTSGHLLTIDGRLGGVALGTVAALLRAPFLVVIVVAGATAALLRLAGLP